MMNNTIIRRKGEIKTEAELKTLLENRGGGKLCRENLY